NPRWLAPKGVWLPWDATYRAEQAELRRLEDERPEKERLETWSLKASQGDQEAQKRLDNHYREEQKLLPRRNLEEMAQPGDDQGKLELSEREAQDQKDFEDELRALEENFNGT